MLTQEQIKNLKPGDPLVVQGEFCQAYNNGNILVRLSVQRWETSIHEIRSFHPSCVSLPTEHKAVIDARDIFRNMSEGEKAMVDNFLSSYFRETKKQEEMRNALKKMGIDLTNIRHKHDPCRLFRKGDKVERRTVDGRTDIDVEEGCTLTVMTNEDEYGNLRVIFPSGRLIKTKSVFLKLIAPVEELEPYIVVDAHTHWDVAVKDMKTIASYSKVHHPNAKAAAEAERDRLNSEYRKEQNNG